MKFSEMKYERVELEAAKTRLTDLLNRFKAATTAEETFAVYKEDDEYSRYINSMIAISYIRHTINTKDEFYEKEVAHYDEITPQLSELWQEFTKAMLAHPFRKDMEAAWGNLMFVNAELSLKTFNPSIVEDLQEENKLSTEYEKLIASAEIDFDGKKLNLAGLDAYSEDTDRAMRKAAQEAQAAWYNSNAAKLDEIFDKLVKIRHRIAGKLGHDSFTQVGYYRMQRNCYDQEMVAKFRQGVVEHIVPLVHEMNKAQAARIGVADQKVYDLQLHYPDGNAKPQGTPEEIFAHGKKMYEELSPDTAEFMNFMLDSELFDVLTRPGKAAGGYCYGIQMHKAPFIFANFNGTADDIGVLTHEAGHAYADYASKDIYPSGLRNYSSDIAEIHSMAMEFLTWPWMAGFFGEENVDKYRNIHLAKSLAFIPYGVMVDEFQHHVYDKPNMTPAQRHELWKELEAKYRPWMDTDNIPFLSEGRIWQAKAHIYVRPFYYIDYCLAQIMALSFWAEAQTNHEDAWEKYKHLVSLAGTKTFVELIDITGMPSPFVPENIKKVTQAAAKWLS
ncbi:MAG: M3 family oligoendopeptidase [Defluviitaleaceae bacterium]|nr:M3 family oligoendopeptidase [Defluviitaleaceae bacterium]